MQFSRIAPLAAAALLAGCATHHHDHGAPVVYRTDTTPSTTLPAQAGEQVVFDNRMSEADRAAWVRQNAVPVEYERVYDQTLQPRVIRVVEERPVYVRSHYSPVHLNIGYSSGRRGGHHGRHHGGWHTGIGWSLPLYW